MNPDIAEVKQLKLYNLKKQHKSLQKSNTEYREFVAKLEKIVEEKIYFLTNNDTWININLEAKVHIEELKKHRKQITSSTYKLWTF